MKDAGEVSGDDEPRRDLRDDEEEEVEPPVASQSSAIPIDISRQPRILRNKSSELTTTDDIFLTDLSGLQLMGSRQLAALSLHIIVEKFYSLNDLLAIVDAREKKSIWSKMINAVTGPKKASKGIMH